MSRRYGRYLAAAETAWPPIAALGLVLAESVLALAGLRWPPLVAVVLVVAPGLALQPLLPAELGTLGRWLAVPIVGCAAGSVVVISASALGVPLTGVSVRVLLAAVAAGGVAAAVFLGGPAWASRPERANSGLPGMAVALALAAVVCAGIGLQSRVIGGTPVPGTDWGHYLLYPDQIAKQNSLAIDNPYWMLGGEPFRDDPGAAALYAPFLLMSGADTSVLVHGIWLFAVLAIVSVFLFASSLWGTAAGLVAAALYAVIPMNFTMLGWHGLGNVHGLALLPLVLLAAGWALRGHGGRRLAFLLALMLVALAAAHRLTFVVAAVALALAAAAGLAMAADRRGLLRFGLRTAACAAPLAVLVAVDLLRRGSGAGGVQSYKTYLVTKVDIDLAVSDLTFPVALAGAVALAALIPRVRADRALLGLFGLALAVVLLAYGWIFHMPTVYYRMVYFLPLALAPAIAVALVWIWHDAPFRGPRLRMAAGAAAVVLGVGLMASAAVVAADRGPKVRDFYAWASDASLTGLAQVERSTGPHDVVVTDRCWGFLAPWLLQRPVLAGIDPADILPSWEAPPAATARTILYGRPDLARRTALRYRVSFVILNPGCASDETDGLRLPSVGVPVYESTRLVVLDLRREAG